MTRRSLFESLLAGSAALRVGFPRSKPGPKIGVTDWNLELTGKLAAVELAARLHFDGVQVSLGQKPVSGKLPLDDASIQAQYLAAARQHRIPLDGTCLDILHIDHLKDNPRAQKWVADSIPITANLKAGVVLLPFFGKASLTNHTEMDYVADLLKEIAPAAEKAGVKLGLEDTISAEDNVRIMERTGSPAVSVYYDVGNSMHGGFDVVNEIRWLGASRICQMHLKDNPHYLGEGTINFPAVMKAITAIGYDGFANLETDCPSKSVENDMARNLNYIRGLLS
ncbi:MAG TPA: sugar phosphate isomerase/epimerase family protein [Bryobacteraceae bacterium]|nr:sugar phosphate isomerase/epimerase family protein [Bryobacteraceae bacterium]